MTKSPSCFATQEENASLRHYVGALAKDSKIALAPLLKWITPAFDSAKASWLRVLRLASAMD